MPTVEHVGVSRKIESDNERHRLRNLIQTIRAEEDIPSGGFIVRTAGVGISEEDLREDVRYLVRTWLDIRSPARNRKRRLWSIRISIWCSDCFAISCRTTSKRFASIGRGVSGRSSSSLIEFSRGW